jgi:hypothetical protein
MLSPNLVLCLLRAVGGLLLLLLLRLMYLVVAVNDGVIRHSMQLKLFCIVLSSGSILSVEEEGGFYPWRRFGSKVSSEASLNSSGEWNGSNGSD